MKLLILFIFTGIFVFTVASKTNGQYKLVVKDMVECKKPSKPQNCSYINIRVDEEGTLYTNFSVSCPVGPVQGRIKVSKKSNGNYVSAFNYKQDNVCTFYDSMKVMIPAPLYYENNCILKTQNRVVKVSNVDDVAHKYLGSSFFYGQFKFRVEWYTVKMMVLCLDAFVDTVPV